MKTDVLFQILTDVEFLYPHVEVSKHYPATKYFYVYDYKANCSGPGTVGCYKDEYGELKFYLLKLQKKNLDFILDACTRKFVLV